MPQPPALAWVEPFCQSLSGALGTSVTGVISKTVNPLVWRISFSWNEPIEGKAKMSLWNLVQQWTSKNEALIVSKSAPTPFSMILEVGVKTLGWKAKNKHPMDGK